MTEFSLRIVTFTSSHPPLDPGHHASAVHVAQVSTPTGDDIPLVSFHDTAFHILIFHVGGWR
jgi:hypothetical protein